MPKSSICESVLALVAGRDRVGAIYGDLVEIAATRGSLWFWAAYMRTLLTFGWRIPAALVAAVVVREGVFEAFHASMRHAPAGWRTAGGPYLNLLNSAGPLMACIMSTLWFVLPFALVRYGWRDRLVRLTAAMALGTTIAFWFLPWASALFMAATVALGIAALLSVTWRRATEALLWTGLAGVLLLIVSVALDREVATRVADVRIANYIYWSGFAAPMVAIAIFLSRMHAVFLGSHEDRNIAC